MNTKPNLEFSWYAINVSNKNVDQIIEDIKALDTPRIKKIVNLSDIFEKSRVRIRIIFLNLCLSKKLKQAIISIEGVRFFLPNNNSPYTFNDLNQFLKYHFDKKDIKNISDKYLHVHESKKGNLGSATLNKVLYKIGDMILINQGIFKDHYAIIKSIEDENLNVEVQMEYSATNISISINVSDTELIKK